MKLGILIFIITYILISARRLGWLGLDRPAGALLGAVACVLAGVLTPDQAFSSIDGRTLLLLFGMMGMGAFLASDGFFERAAQSLAEWAGTPARLLGAIIWSAGILSALITNDAVCVLGAPIVVSLIKQHNLPPLPFLLALATAANTGSVATLVGNPQNMLCASLGNLSYRSHLLLMLPVTAAGLLLNHLLIRFSFRSVLKGVLKTGVSCSEKVLTGRTMFILSVIGGSVGVYSLGADLAWTSAAGLLVLLVALRPDPQGIWEKIDWSVLLFFCGLFVVVEGFVSSGAPDWIFRHFVLWQGNHLWGWLRTAFIFLAGSNVVSNVPFILVVRGEMAGLPDPALGWEMLAMASTFAGNLTLMGSVANIIVAEKSREVGGMGFLSYLKIGFPLAVLTTLLGAFWLILIF